MGIHAKALWTLQVSMTALSGDATLPLVSRWFGTSRGLGEGRLSTSVGYPLRQPWSKKHTTKRVRCVSVTVPAWGPGAGPGPVLAADAVRPSPVARAVHGEIVSTPRRRPHVEYPDSQNLLGLPGSELQQPPGKRWIDYLPCMLDEVLAAQTWTPQICLYLGAVSATPSPLSSRGFLFLPIPYPAGLAPGAWRRKRGGVLVARRSIRGLGIHPAHPRTVPDRIASGGLVADATPPPLIRLPDSCGRGLEASTTTQSVPLQGKWALQPAARCMV